MIKAQDLVKEQKKRDDNKMITYDKIYKLVEKKILLASSGNNYETYYEIPQFLLGLPLYSVKDCSVYIQKKLKENGFKVDCFEGTKLYISWK